MPSPDLHELCSPQRRRVVAASASAAVIGLAGCSGLFDRSETRRSETPSTADQSPPGTATAGESDATPDVNESWQTVHADAANTGHVEATGPRGTPSILWQRSLDLQTTVRATTGPRGPVATQEDGTLLAYDADGMLRWRRRHEGAIKAAPAVGRDGAIVVCTLDGDVVAYEPDGTRRWVHETSGRLSAIRSRDVTPVRIADDTVVFSHPTGETCALSLADGTPRWEVEGPHLSRRPAIADGRVFLVGARTGKLRRSLLQAVSLSDGAELWRANSEGSIRLGPAVDEGVLYTGDAEGRVLAWEAASGEERWRVRLDGDSFVITPPVVFGGRIWVGTYSDGIFGVTEGGIEAHADVFSPTTPVAGADRLFVGTYEFERGPRSDVPGAVVAIDADGKEIWRTKTRGRPRSTVRYRDGHVVAGTQIGALERLGAGDGRRTWRAIERPDRLPAPVVGGAAVYCGDRRVGVHAYGVTGSRSDWYVSFDGPAPASPIVADKTVLAGSRGGEVAGTRRWAYAERPTGRLTRTPTGNDSSSRETTVVAPQPRWRTTLGGPVGDVGYDGDVAYLGSGTSVVSMTVDGDLRWKIDAGGRVRGAPAVDAGTVFAGTTDGNVLALAAADGRKRWRRQVGETATAPAVARRDGTATVVLGTTTGVVALEAGEGGERWRTDGGHVRGAPAIAGDISVVGDSTGVVRGLALSDGTERWRHRTEGPIHGSPAVAAGTAYVGSRDGHLHAVSVRDGSKNWRLELPDWVDGSPALAYGGVVVLDQSGTISMVVGDQ